MTIKIKRKKTKQISLSTGSTLLNLALSDSVDGGFLPGKYYYYVGDSKSGKTFFCITCMAEACRSDHFQHYRRIYDNVEDGMLMNCARLFGKETADLIEPPAFDDAGQPVFSETIEDFYYHIDDAIKNGDPFIYVLDSMDGVEARDDQKKFDDQKKAHRRGVKTAGTYGMAKAKANSVGLRKVIAGLRDTGSILIIISQTRGNPNAGMFEPKKTRSGGHALTFYATTEIWTSLAGKLKKTVRGIPRTIGNKVRLQIRKNRITGGDHTIQSMIYPSYGIDDIGSNVDYLVTEKWWKKAKGGTVTAKEFKMKLKRSPLIKHIEARPSRVAKLQRVVGACWKQVLKDCDLGRKQRYE